MVVPLCLCAHGGWCVAHSSPSLLYSIPSLASCALLARSSSCRLCPLGVLCCVCGVLGHLAPVHWCALSVRCFACALSWATWLLFTGAPERRTALLVGCSGPLGSCSPVCPLGVLCCVCGVLGHLAPVHRCARSVLCFACAVSWATWLLFTSVTGWFVVLCLRCPGPLSLLFTGAPARCVALLVRGPGPIGSCSPVCPLSVFRC